MQQSVAEKMHDEEVKFEIFKSQISPANPTKTNPFRCLITPLFSASKSNIKTSNRIKHENERKCKKQKETETYPSQPASEREGGSSTNKRKLKRKHKQQGLMRHFTTSSYAFPVFSRVRESLFPVAFLRLSLLLFYFFKIFLEASVVAFRNSQGEGERERRF